MLAAIPLRYIGRLSSGPAGARRRRAEALRVPANWRLEPKPPPVPRASVVTLIEKMRAPSLRPCHGVCKGRRRSGGGHTPRQCLERLIREALGVVENGQTAEPEPMPAERRQ